MSPRTKARLLFGSALILISLSSVASLVAISRIINSQGWVTHSREVQVALGEINTVVTRAGRMRVEYTDSGNLARLENYQAALGEVQTAVDHLKLLLRDNPSQLSRTSELGKLVEQRTSLMNESVALKQRSQSTLESQSRITQRIIAVAAEMDSIIQTMQDQEQYLLALRTTRLRTGEREAAIFLALAFVLSIMLFVLYYVLLNIELEGRQNAELSLRSLSARILQIQDEERRKFSRELHDSLGQYLAAAKMNLDMLGRNDPTESLIVDASRLLDEAISETRTISHLLHPPLLDETGFASAAQWYVDGFSKRSGIKARIEMPDHFERLPDLVEIALFRILQEGLTNIHRHSGSSSAEVVVKLQRDKVILTIHDNGGGISPKVLEKFRSDGANMGVGLAGMRERVRELRGQFDIKSDATGTLVTAILPVSPKVQESTKQGSTPIQVAASE